MQVHDRFLEFVNPLHVCFGLLTKVFVGCARNLQGPLDVL